MTGCYDTGVVQLIAGFAMEQICLNGLHWNYGSDLLPFKTIEERSSNSNQHPSCAQYVHCHYHARWCFTTGVWRLDKVDTCGVRVIDKSRIEAVPKYRPVRYTYTVRDEAPFDIHMLLRDPEANIDLAILVTNTGGWKQVHVVDKEHKQYKVLLRNERCRPVDYPKLGGVIQECLPDEFFADYNSICRFVRLVSRTKKGITRFIKPDGFWPNTLRVTRSGTSYHDPGAHMSPLEYGMSCVTIQHDRSYEDNDTFILRIDSKYVLVQMTNHNLVGVDCYIIDTTNKTWGCLFGTREREDGIDAPLRLAYTGNYDQFCIDTGLPVYRERLHRKELEQKILELEEKMRNKELLDKLELAEKAKKAKAKEAKEVKMQQ